MQANARFHLHSSNIHNINIQRDLTVSDRYIVIVIELSMTSTNFSIFLAYSAMVFTH